MAYDSTSPANDEYLADFPPKMREQLRAIIDDQIVNALKLQGLIPANTTGNIPVSNGNVNTNLNADFLDGKHSTSFADAAHTHSSATQQAAGLMAAADKKKLDGIATGAEVNQNAFSNVVYGSTTIQADSKTDTLTLDAGANILITPDATNDKVTIGVTGTVDKAADCSGNAATATKLATARAIALSGKATGTVTFDGSADVSINVTAVSADSATNDANGNDIADTYATQTALTNDINNIPVFTGATSGAAGASGLVPQPKTGEQEKYLKADGTWSNINKLNPNTLWDALHFYGINYVPSDTTNNGWNSLGFASISYTQNKIQQQPGQYGQLINIPADTGSESTQLWLEQYNGRLFYRGGNSGNSVNNTPFKAVATTDEVNSAEKVDSQGDNWIRYNSGLQLCWNTNIGDHAPWSFPVAFSSTPAVTLTGRTGDWVWADNLSTTGCTNRCNGISCGIAIGRWK